MEEENNTKRKGLQGITYKLLAGLRSVGHELACAHGARPLAHGYDATATAAIATAPSKIRPPAKFIYKINIY